MNSIGDILRNAREQQGRTLEEIAATTRINKKFLEQIEADIKPALPNTYYRAFLRSFALEVGVDPATLLPADLVKIPSPGETGTTPEASVASPAEPRAISTAPQVIQPEIPAGGPAKSRGVKGNPALILFGVILIAAAAMVAIILWMRHEREQKPVQEISFPDVVREQESQPGQSAGTAPSADSLQAEHPVAGRDSLTLEASASDSVWLRVEPDTMAAREVTLPPRGEARFRARYKFTLSVGNAKAVSFRLNGKPLGLLSSSPKPMSNITYSWSTLDTIRKAPINPPGVPSGTTSLHDAQQSHAAPPHSVKNAGMHTVKKSSASTQKKKKTAASSAPARQHMPG